MGRLEDIIERNKNPGKARKAAGEASASSSGSGSSALSGSAADSAAKPPAKPKGLEGLSRLEQIAERNRNPGKYGRKGVTMGVLVAMFVFLILVLMVFTDLDESPDAQPDPTPAAAPSGEKRVDGVYMYREKRAPNGSAVAK